MYSNRKPYYQLKKSMTDFFSGYSRFIKESLTKESVAEKPYLGDVEYPQMHLNLPRFTFPDRKFAKPSPYQVPTTDYRIARMGLTIHRYLRPDCELDTWNMPDEFDWGDIFEFEGDAHLPASTPHSFGSRFQWYLTSSTEKILLQMIDDDARWSGRNPTFQGLILDGAPSEATICAKASIAGVVSSYTWINYAGFPVSFQRTGPRSGFQAVSEKPFGLIQKDIRSYNLNCGCFDIRIASNLVEVPANYDTHITNYGSGGWASVHDAGSGQNIRDAFAYHAAAADRIDPTIWIRRSFLSFDLSNIPTDAIIVSCSFFCSLYVEGTPSGNTKVLLQKGTFPIPASVADFDSFTGASFGDVTGSSPLSYAPAEIIFNSTGIAYIQSIIGETARLCMREYTHDYLDTIPVNNEDYAYADIESIEVARQAYLKINYSV